jgi:PLD-like domain
VLFPGRWGRLAVVVAGLLLLAACTGDGRPGRDRDLTFEAPPGALLARPSDDGEEDRNRTLRVLLRLIENTPAGERIRIVGNSFSYVPVADALAQAHDRGVDVQVIVYDAVSREWKAPTLLRDVLGEDRRADSFIQLAPGGVHQKVWSFSRTGDSRDVVLVGSMNLTYFSAGQYTDMYSYVDRPDVRRTFDRRFEDLSRFLPDPPPFGPIDLGRDRAWFYPGYTLATDPVLQQLSAVPPAGARIRVVMYAWLDERGLDLAELLVAKDTAGADVEIVLGASTGPLVREVLEGTGVELHPGVFDDGTDVHHKLTLVSHPTPDGGRTRYVLTGSDNFTTKSLGRPEVLLRLDGEQGDTFRRYDRWVDALVAWGERERD